MFKNIYFRILRFLTDREWLSYPRFSLYWNEGNLSDVEIIDSTAIIGRRAALYFDKFSNNEGTYIWADFKRKVSAGNTNGEWLELAVHHCLNSGHNRYLLFINIEKNYLIKFVGAEAGEQYPIGKHLCLFPPFE